MVSLSSLGLGFCSARPAAHRWDVADAEPELSQVNTTGSVGRRLENLSWKGSDRQYFKLVLWAFRALSQLFSSKVQKQPKTIRKLMGVAVSQLKSLFKNSQKAEWAWRP